MAKLPHIDTRIASFNPVVLESLINDLSTLASVYHKPASTFIDPSAYKRAGTGTSKAAKSGNIRDLTKLAKQEIINNAKNENLLDFDDEGTEASDAAPSLLDELNDLFITPGDNQGSLTNQSTNDILNLFGPPQPKPATNTERKDTNDLLDLF